MKTKVLYSIPIVFCMLLCNGMINAQADYEEIGGVVVMEAESIIKDGWSFEADNLRFNGFKEAGYIRSNETSPTPGNEGLIEVKIKINKTGKYLFKWHSRVGIGDESTEGNDSWLRFNDADAFYAQKPDMGEVVTLYPRGREGNPPDAKFPVGSSSQGWFKIWSSGATQNWTWWTATNDFNGFPIFVEFDTSGIYTMEISGRSADNLLDKIVLSSKSEDVATTSPNRVPIDEDTREDSFSLATSTFDLSKSGIAIYPNPAKGILNIRGLKDTSATIQLIDAVGRIFPSQILSKNSEVLQLDTTTLAPGLYFVRIGALGQSAFMIE